MRSHRSSRVAVVLGVVGVVGGMLAGGLAACTSFDASSGADAGAPPGPNRDGGSGTAGDAEDATDLDASVTSDATTGDGEADADAKPLFVDGFEATDNASCPGWATSNAEAATTTDDKRSGGRSCRLCPTSAVGQIQHTLAHSSAGSYAFEVYAKNAGALPLKVSATITFLSNNVKVTQVQGSIVTVEASGFEPVQVDGPAPAKFDAVKLVLAADGNGTCALFDDVRFGPR